MKTIITCLFLLGCTAYLHSQNVGIGTATPTEKLDVNGSVNLKNQLKINGDSGTAYQALMKDASNNLVWGDLSEFKNMQIFDCANVAAVAGTNNCSATWGVPTGVTTILVECWGGGGGGGNFTGGGGAGYASARLTVTPLTTASITVGAGGNFGSTSTDGISGGNTVFSVGAAVLNAYGGGGGGKADVTTTNPGTVGQTLGGTFLVSGITSGFIGYYGSPGGISKLTFVQVAAGEFAKQIDFGGGGDAALLPNSGAKGGYKLNSASVNHQILATQSGIQPGGGGGADATWGFYGRGGRVIIRW